MPTQRERKRGRQLPAALAAPDFPAQLPITPRIDEIVDLLRRHQVLVVAGETGSGKTTQLPKACLAAGIGRFGAIAHTQPRRVAARAVSARIAEELGVELGREVGYAVRFADQTSADTVLKVMTDGLLLNEIQRDRRLGRYQCVIVDEAHERSLNVDFILGYLKRLLPRRRDLKVIITSATIDVEAFAKHFDDAPVVQVSGRGHPVETVYRPLETDDAERSLVACLETILRDAPSGRRDILVFQTGEREIFDNTRMLKKAFDGRLDILPLYARLPNSEQQRVFSPTGRQRVVLATNVAETSITVPNIGYVIDPGFARISRYSYRAKLQRLPVEPISQASAAQRAGRCGRIAPGVCFRLYGEDDLASRPRYTDAEIKRTNLASVMLTMRAFGLGRIDSFPFIDPPHPRAISDASRLLHELQAIDDDELTPVGRQMARLPVDPRLARMLIEAGRTGALAETLVIVSALASQDPRLRPLDRREAADQAHARFEQSDEPTAADGHAERKTKANERSDFVVFLNLWRWLEDRRAELRRSAFRRLLEKSFLSPPRVREWQSLHRQLRLACRDLGMKLNTQPADYATLHRALLSGSLGFIGHRREPESDGEHRGERQRGRPKRRQSVEYDGARGLQFRLFPASALSRRPPSWVVAAEISDTGHTWARCVASLEPTWIEAAAEHIKKSTFSSPRWDDARGEAVVDERVTVYGLTVVAGRPRRAAESDPETARQLFVQEMLVKRHRAGAKGRANSAPKRPEVNAPFLDHNEDLLRRLDERQARGRRVDLLVGEKACESFYLARLPHEVCSVASWRRFVGNASVAQLKQLEMTEADVLADVATHFDPEEFPTRLVCGEQSVSLAYKFAPGERDDGVTARVDLAQLAELDADALDWLVPGFFEEKCVALFRALPKAHRRQLAPVPDRVRTILPRLLTEDSYRQGKLSVALSAALRDVFGISIPASAWQMHDLPPHLRMNVQVATGAAAKRDQDRDVEALRGRALAKSARADGERWREALERHGIIEFPSEGVPQTRIVCGRQSRLAVYPLLADRGDSVDLLMFQTSKGRAALNRAGHARLALLADRAATRHLRRHVEHDGQLALHYAPLGSIAELADTVLLAAAWFAYFEGRSLPTTATAFAERLASTKLAPVVAETVAHAKAILAKRFEVAKALDDIDSPAFAPSVADMASQLDDIAGAQFLANASSDWLTDICRYLDGMAHRIANLRPVKRDLERMEAIKPWQDRLLALSKADDDETFEDLRYLVQEFRIATFSQGLGTREKVSAKRLEVRFAAAESALALR